ncbi:MAG: MBOAT family protein [Paludisphaera borealis]|uniref:MBOAT family O-acyltransferase n=1 Tax=Paludisphaera borealis TaxID=1387353 RepID=UPI002850FDBA|nr:MBOAT family protein [Paludisphaera borealis]MDR3622074.1 MBOAT family protein [Paludisphaera borealis]
MLFTEPTFLFLFLPTVVLIHCVLRPRLRNLWLLAASFLFYCWGEGRFVLLMVGSITLNYVFGLLLGYIQRPTLRKLLLGAGVASNLLVLIYFKYCTFLVANLDAALAWLQLPPVEVGLIPLPLGISFLTFHTISYLSDVYRGTIKRESNPIDLALYVMLFPHLIAGPIVRYADIVAAMKSRTLAVDEFAYGIRRFLGGLAKKLLIANQLAATADLILGIPSSELNAGLSWLAMACYTFQIYFDFSGYSDMAIGLAHMFGIRFHENFDHPYWATSVTDFWRRWHISLSSWFRDYVYIPLGGNRRGSARTYSNLMTIFLLCGLWHGANWTFIVWGLYQGAFLVIERVGLGRILDRLWRPLRHAYLVLAVVVGWVVFRMDTLSGAGEVLRAMFGFGSGAGIKYHVSLYLTNEVAALLAIAALLSTPLLGRLGRKIEEFETTLADRWGSFAPAPIRLARVAAYCSILVLCLSFVAQKSYNPFIYFRF